LIIYQSITSNHEDTDATGLTDLVRKTQAVYCWTMEEASAPAPAVDPTILIPALISECISEGEAASLAVDQTFMSAQLRQHQIVRLMEFGHETFNRALEKRDVARAFHVNPEVVRRALKRGYSIPSARGRHPQLSDDIESELLIWIQQKAENKKAVNRTELLHHCNERYEQSITRGWVDSFVTRHRDQLFETVSLPQENPRLEVPRRLLDSAVDCLKTHVHGACAELVFNLVLRQRMLLTRPIFGQISGS